jgi:hypothetical protein
MTERYKKIKAFAELMSMMLALKIVDGPVSFDSRMKLVKKLYGQARGA